MYNVIAEALLVSPFTISTNQPLFLDSFSSRIFSQISPQPSLQYSSNDATVLHHQQPVNANHVSILQDHQIDKFLAQSPSQSLGAEAIKLKHTIGSIPNFSIADRQPTLSQHSLSVGTKTDFLIAADSYTPYSEQLNDSSPPNSLTGTAVSSRSGSPSFNNNGVDGAGLSRGFKSDPYLSAKHKTSFEHNSHTAVLAQNHEPHFNPNPVHQEAPKSQFNYVNSRQNIYDTSRLMTFQNQSVTLRSASGTVYPPTLNGNDDQSQPLFFVAMPSHDGRGQILRPVQMMQIPGQPNAFLVPSGKISDVPPLLRHIRNIFLDMRLCRVPLIYMKTYSLFMMNPMVIAPPSVHGHTAAQMHTTLRMIYSPIL